MIKLFYVLASVITMTVLIAVAVIGRHYAWGPVMFIGTMLIAIIIMTVFMTATTVLLQHWRKERGENDKNDMA